MSQTLIQEIGADLYAVKEKLITFFETNPTVVVIENDFKKAFALAESIVERNGGQLLLTAATNVLPDLLTGKWEDAAANALADAKAAGAVTIPEEEQLAASTALQVAQVIAGPAATVAPAPVVAPPPVDAPPEPPTPGPGADGTDPKAAA